jgi:hypothetical protein
MVYQAIRPKLITWRFRGRVISKTSIFTTLEKMDDRTPKLLPSSSIFSLTFANSQSLVFARIDAKPGKNMPKPKFSRSKQGTCVEKRNKEVLSAFHCRVGGAKRSMETAVVVRQQTLEEQRSCMTAIQLLLTEMVRQQLGCQGERK